MPDVTLWMTEDKTRFFEVPQDYTLPPGNLTIITPSGQRKSVETDSLGAFEVNEKQALPWAREELGDSLTELKQSIEAKLDEWRRQLDEFNKAPLTTKTNVTPEAGSVFYELLTELPKVFRESTSGDKAQLAAARQTMADLEGRFAKAGLDVEGKVEAFPGRLALIKNSNAEEAGSSAVGGQKPGTLE